MWCDVIGFAFLLSQLEESMCAPYLLSPKNKFVAIVLMNSALHARGDHAPPFKGDSSDDFLYPDSSQHAELNGVLKIARFQHFSERSRTFKSKHNIFLTCNSRIFHSKLLKA